MGEDDLLEAVANGLSRLQGHGPRYAVHPIEKLGQLVGGLIGVADVRAYSSGQATQGGHQDLVEDVP